MGRLIVAATAAEFKDHDEATVLNVWVSVSSAADGGPVTGLTYANFRFTSPFGATTIHGTPLKESKWEPDDLEATGCYLCTVDHHGSILGSPSERWVKGQSYPFGVQVRTFDNTGTLVDMGQTVVRVTSLGT